MMFLILSKLRIFKNLCPLSNKAYEPASVMFDTEAVAAEAAVPEVTVYNPMCGTDK